MLTHHPPRYTPRALGGTEEFMARKEFTVVIARQKETVTVTLAGEAHFDFDTGDQHIAKVLAYKPKEVVVRAAELRFVSSVGMCFLLNLRHQVQEAGGCLRLEGLQPQVRRVMEQAHVLQLFDAPGDGNPKP
jgi:anti-anti-sigma factor